MEEVGSASRSGSFYPQGRGYPKDAGICEDVVRCLGDHIPILGVCLGHQAICEVYGATISHARCLMHGKQSCIKINTDSLIFRGLPEEVPVARYHSLAAQRDTMPDCLTIIGEDAYGEVMAVKHRDFPVYGLQFHPESILTPDGKKMMRNFCYYSDRKSEPARACTKAGERPSGTPHMSIKVERSYTICEFLYNKGGHTDDPGKH